MNSSDLPEKMEFEFPAQVNGRETQEGMVALLSIIDEISNISEVKRNEHTNNCLKLANVRYENELNLLVYSDTYDNIGKIGNVGEEKNVVEKELKREENEEKEKKKKSKEKLYLVAVGVEINSGGLQEMLDKELPESKGKRPANILSGVYYGEKFSNQHTRQQTYAKKGDGEMMHWFDKKRVQCGNDARAFIKRLHISKKWLHISKNGRIAAGEVYTGTDKFFVFFYNENEVPTTMIKKELCGGYTSHYAANYRTVDFERIELSYRPYYHHQKEKKNYIEYE